MGNKHATTSIMIVGVGGQGTLLASKLLGAVVQKRFDVKVSEVHGMSQRGGSVVTYVRYGQSVASPIIEQGEADCILAFEELEAARYLPYLKMDGLMVVNTRRIDPMPVILGNAKAPDGVIGKIGQHSLHLEQLDALALAEQAGSAKAVNLVMIGRFAEYANLPVEEWEAVIRETVPEKYLDVNLKAFYAGYNREKE